MNSQPVYNLHYFQLHVRCSRSLRPPTLYKQLQAAISLAITIFPVTLINADGKIHNPILQEHTTASLAAFIVKWIKSWKCNHISARIQNQVLCTFWNFPSRTLQYTFWFDVNCQHAWDAWPCGALYINFASSTCLDNNRVVAVPCSIIITSISNIPNSPSPRLWMDFTLISWLHWKQIFYIIIKAEWQLGSNHHVFFA